jgi:hypothetical protein
MHQVAPKTIDARIVHCRQCNGFTIYPINKVFRRTDVLAGSFFRVPYLAQLASKTLKQWPSTTVSEFSNACGGFKQRCEHDVLLW